VLPSPLRRSGTGAFDRACNRVQDRVCGKGLLGAAGDEAPPPGWCRLRNGRRTLPRRCRRRYTTGAVVLRDPRPRRPAGPVPACPRSRPRQMQVASEGITTPVAMGSGGYGNQEAAPLQPGTVTGLTDSQPRPQKGPRPDLERRYEAKPGRPVAFWARTRLSPRGDHGASVRCPSWSVVRRGPLPVVVRCPSWSVVADAGCPLPSGACRPERAQDVGSAGVGPSYRE
jgi:hypothetical protein